MNKKQELFKYVLTGVLGILYGFISVYWLSLGIVMAANLYGEDNGRYEEYASWQPLGFFILLLYLFVFVGIMIMLRTKKKLALFLSSGVVTALLFFLLSSIR